MRRNSKLLVIILSMVVIILGGSIYLEKFSSFKMPNFKLKASANDILSYKFDFGVNGIENGYIGVSATDAYSSDKGYGFNNISSMKNVNASGMGALSDAVQFIESGAKSNNTFNLDLPNGLYQITVTLGDTNRTSIAAEGMLQLINLTGNNATETFQIPVTDGQLNILATAGKEGYAYTLSTLEVTQISDNPTMKQTIWICGDSTVCNYYPKDSSAMVGWGQVLDKYVDTNIFDVRNMAAGGQYAKGFVDAGQFDVIEKYGKEGDYYLISIGINDTNYSNETEYYEVVTDMVKRAKDKGITVILVKQQGRASDVTNHPNLTGRWFGSTLDKIGTEQQVQVIDLFAKALDYYKSIGQEETNKLFYDDLHHNKDGADVLARLISESTTFESLKDNQKLDDTDSTEKIENQENTEDKQNNEDIQKDVTIYIVGDSTACNYKASDYPQAGWGQKIGTYLSDKYTISNHAIGGRSSRKFVEEGRWDRVCNSLKPGDYVLIQFGINDANYNSSDRYAPTDGTFQKYMSQLAKETLDKKATPIFLTPVLGLGNYSNGKFVNGYDEYCNVTKEIAVEYNISCIDVNSLMVEHYNNIGYDKAFYYHMISTSETSTDRTHFTELGADNVAKIIAEQLMDIL